ncbi:hypothetical protein NL676_015851 [Syzygium grande]|nr:hypothetical protein NL676_015851 [Syzygium grande]
MGATLASRRRRARATLAWAESGLPARHQRDFLPSPPPEGRSTPPNLASPPQLLGETIASTRAGKGPRPTYGIPRGQPSPRPAARGPSNTGEGGTLTPEGHPGKIEKKIKKGKY